jgi:hypothetical protein
MSFRHLLGALLFAAGTGFSQQPEAMPPPADIAKNLETLRSLAPALATAEEDLAAMRAELDKADTEGAKCANCGRTFGSFPAEWRTKPT